MKKVGCKGTNITHTILCSFRRIVRFGTG